MSPFSDQHESEFVVVTRSAAATIFDEPDEHLARLLQGPIDWEHVLRHAVYHGVHTLLHQTLSGHFSEQVPGDVLDRLHGSYVRTAARNLMQGGELVRVSRLFAAHDVQLISFKGPVLAAGVYKNLALRPSTDLDILIRKDKIDTVRELLTDDGYAEVQKQGDGRLTQAVHTYLAQQIPFVKAPSFALDVHIRMMPPGYSYAFSFDELYKRSHGEKLSGVEVQSFQSEDLLLVLCYHGIKNRWERLKHVCDVAALIQSETDLDWDTVLERARATHGVGVLFMGLYLAAKLMAVRIPEDIWRNVASDDRTVQTGERLIQALPNQVNTGIAEFSQRFRLHLGVQDTIVNKARYCLYSVLRRIE